MTTKHEVSEPVWTRGTVLPTPLVDLMNTGDYKEADDVLNAQVLTQISTSHGVLEPGVVLRYCPTNPSD